MTKLQHTKELEPITPKDRREIRDVLLAGLAVTIMGKLAAHSNMYKDMKPLRTKVAATYQRLKNKYPESISTFAMANATFEKLAENLLETTDDLTLMQAFNYIDDLNAGNATVTVNTQAND